MSKPKDKIKVVLTGGHAGATAYAFAQTLRKDTSINCDLFWIGAKRAVEGSSHPTFEQKALPLVGIKIFAITAGRIQRRFTHHTIPSILKIPVGFFQAFKLVLRIRPKAIVSFGGFASFPVVVIGYLMRIPVIIHEQTIVYGRANKVASFFVKKIALSRKESLKYFDRSKCEITGNPVSEEILKVGPKVKMGNPPTIFITGGSRGSEKINETVGLILPKLLSKYIVVHQVGEASLDKFKKVRESLGEMSHNYKVYGILEPKNWAEEINIADIIVSRAGANFVSELLIIKRPAILIPIPWTFMDEQTKNAEYAKEFGIASILLQRDLTPQRLLETIDQTFGKWKTIIDKVSQKRSPDVGASKRLVSLLKEYLN